MLSAYPDAPTRHMSHLHLTPDHARALHLHAQGLLTPPRRKASKADVLAAIRRMALLQIDTISVVARSPYLVLFSRLGHYDPAWLDALLAEGALFEYWAHEACFVPVEDYRLLRHRMLELFARQTARSLHRHPGSSASRVKTWRSDTCTAGRRAINQRASNRQ